MSLRFSFYTLNMMEHKPISKAKSLVAIAGLTDEGFAVLSSLPKEQKQALFFKVAVLCVAYWTFSTIVGVLLGDSVANYIPHLDFALPCLFAILAYEQYKNQRQWKPIVIALIGFLLARQITETSVLLVAILVAIVIVALLPQSSSVKLETKGVKMSNSDILMMFAALVLGSQICRFLPEFLPKKVLSSPILQKLNKMLPLVIMLLLLLTSLSFPKTEKAST